MNPNDPTLTQPGQLNPEPLESAWDAGMAAAFGPEGLQTNPLAVNAMAGTILAGKYKLIEAIGEGGMGSVWVANQSEPVKRKVAVKLIKAGMDSKAVLARFEAERQALAVMDHPNIAKVLDGGLHDGRPFFVMELVKGIPITEYCDANKLTPKQRLELFVPVCNAIQHAHQKGIIHRDIKPSNVLIALYDDKPVPKVIDFGIAKATGSALSENTIETAFGGVVGTPQYMSPEQANLNNLDIDTRSDVYSLGVLMYELLTGSPPFTGKELEKKGFLEILRVVREDEPLRPSTKLSTADALPSLSANRSTEAKKLAGLLRNELDWIVMKALEKNRARRYETANGFAADVNRYLTGEAVLAHPPTTVYRFKKFIRRHKGQVIAVSLVSFALVTGIVGTTWQAIRAENARAAETERAEGERNAKSMAEAERLTAVAKMAEAETQRLRAETNVSDLRNAVRRFTALLDGDARLQQYDLHDVKTKLYTQSTVFYEIIVKQRSADPLVRVECANAWFSLATIHRLKARNAEALAACLQAVSHFAESAKLQDTPAILIRLAHARSELSALYTLNGDKPRSTASMEDALRTIEPCINHADPLWRKRAEVYRAFYQDALVGIHIRNGDFNHAEALLRPATQELPEYETVSPQDRDLWLTTAARLASKTGRLDCQAGRTNDAIRAFSRMGQFHTRLLSLKPTEANLAEIAQGHFTAGSALSSHGKPLEAVEYYQKAEALYSQLNTKYPSIKAYSDSLSAVRRAIIMREEKPASIVPAREVAPSPRAKK